LVAFCDLTEETALVRPKPFGMLTRRLLSGVGGSHADARIGIGHRVDRQRQELRLAHGGAGHGIRATDGSPVAAFHS
jgi:hypothetical protein